MCMRDERPFAWCRCSAATWYGRCINGVGETVIDGEDIYRADQAPEEKNGQPRQYNDDAGAPEHYPYFPSTLALINGTRKNTSISRNAPIQNRRPSASLSSSQSPTSVPGVEVGGAGQVLFGFVQQDPFVPCGQTSSWRQRADVDCLALVRGGGSRSDLAVFDSRRIAEAIAESKATSMRDMGAVMGTVKARAQGRADMSEVSRRVKARLGA